MSDNLHTIFSGTECPPHSVLLAYFRRTLTEEEMHRFEKHLVDCGMCSDELEGLSKMKDPGKVDLIVSELSELIGRKQARIFGMRRNYALMAAAAMLLLILGSAVVIRLLTLSKTPEQMMAVTIPDSTTENAAAEAKASPEDSRSSTRFVAPVQSPKAEGASAENNAMVQDIRVEEAPITVAEERTGDTDKTVGLVNTHEDVPAGGTEAILMADSSMANPVVTESRVTLGYQAGAKKAVKEKDGLRSAAVSKSNQDLESAMTEFAAGHYDIAERLFEQANETDPGNFNVLYHLAYCYYKGQQYKKAIKTLGPILKSSENEYYREASSLSDSISVGKNR